MHKRNACWLVDSILRVGPVNKQGDTPLGFAIRKGKLEIVKFLVSVVNVDVNGESSKFYRTKLCFTAEKYNDALVCSRLLKLKLHSLIHAS